MSNHDASITTPALAESLRRLGSPSFVVAADGDIRWANKCASTLLGVESIGRSLGSFSPAAKRLALLRSIRDLGDIPLEPNRDFNLSLVGASEVTTDLRASSSSSYVLGIFDSALLVCTRTQAQPALAVGNVLTPRQNEILALLRTGKSTKEIAEALSITEHTVRNHVGRILVKLNCHSRLGAIMMMINHEVSYTVGGDADHQNN